LNEIKTNISETEKKLKLVNENEQGERTERTKTEEKLLIAERKAESLYSKLGRTAQFKSKKERDAFLEKEIKTMQQQIEAYKKNILQLEKDMKTLNNDKKTHEGDIDEMKNSLEQRKKRH